MREILFRGRCVADDDIYGWVTGYYVCLKDIWKNRETHRIYNGFAEADCGNFYADYYEVDPNTVGQFIGLTDRNGKQIFDGDICRFKEWSNGDMCWVGKIHYEHQQFVISGKPNKECATDFCLVMSRFIPENIEVIGNIHDNPELV